ncbi:MAG: hypothetical protein ACK50J_19085, partial [Planctomyces sp.]
MSRSSRFTSIRTEDSAALPVLSDPSLFRSKGSDAGSGVSFLIAELSGPAVFLSAVELAATGAMFA